MVCFSLVVLCAGIMTSTLLLHLAALKSPWVFFFFLYLVVDYLPQLHMHAIISGIMTSTLLLRLAALKSPWVFVVFFFFLYLVVDYLPQLHMHAIIFSPL